MHTLYNNTRKEVHCHLKASVGGHRINLQCANTKHCTHQRHHITTLIYTRVRAKGDAMWRQRLSRAAQKGIVCRTKQNLFRLKTPPFARRIRKPANPKEMVCRAKRGCWSTSKRDACKGHKNALLNQTPLANVKKTSQAQSKARQEPTLWPLLWVVWVVRAWPLLLP